MNKKFAVNDVVVDVDTGKRWVVREIPTDALYIEFQSLQQSGKLGKRLMAVTWREALDAYRKVGVWSGRGVKFTR